MKLGSSARTVLVAWAASLSMLSAGWCNAQDLNALLVQLSSSDPEVQSQGMSDLIQAHDGVLPCLPALVEIANNSTRENRLIALDLISGFGPHGKSAANRLRGSLQDKDTRLRIAAANAILSLEKKNEAAVTALGEALHSELAVDRRDAAQMLVQHGVAAKGAVRELIAAADDADPEVRLEAVRALGVVTPTRSDQVIAVLRKRLADELPRIRGAAAEALWNLDEPADELMAVLINLVTTYEPESSRDVLASVGAHDAGVELIGKIGPEAKAAVPALIAALDNPQTGERMAAADALGEIGTASAPAVERLARSLRDTECHSFPFVHRAWYVSDQAAAALRKIGVAARPALIEGLSDKDERVRALAAQQLGFMAFDRQSVAALLAALDDRDDSVRAIAASSLGRMGPAAIEAAPQLAARLNDHGEWISFPGGGIGSRFSVGQHVFEALRSIRPKADQIGPALVKTLKADPRIEPAMLNMLRHLGATAKEVIPALEVLLQDKSQRVKAAQALATIAPDYPGLLEILQTALAEMNDDDLTGVARGLGDLGTRATSVVPALYAAIEKERIEPQIGAAAILKIAPGEVRAARALVEALRESWSDAAGDTWPMLAPHAAAADDFLLAGLTLELPGKEKECFWVPRKESELRLRSAELLIDRGIQTPQVVDALIQLCDSDDCVVRSTSADAIGKIGPAASKAVAALVQLLPDNELYLVGGDFYGNGGERNSPGDHAVDALAKIGKPAVANLSATLRDENWQVRQRAAVALGKIGPTAATAANELSIALKDQNSEVRAAAARALGRIQDSRKQTIAVLVTALADKRLNVRVVVAEAIGELGTQATSAIPALNSLRSDPFESAQKAASRALEQIQR